MQKISDSTNTANAVGEFTEGNPGAGVDATLLKAAWLNAVQREIVGLIQGMGFALNPDDDGQMLKAVQALADFTKLVNKPTTLQGYGITDAIKKGQYGLGASDLPESASDVIGRPGGFYFFGESANTFAQYASVLNLPYGANNSAQLAIRQGAEKASAAIRSVNARGDWTPVAELWTEVNFNPALKANLASPTFTGIPRVPTPAPDSNTDQAANTAFVRAAIAELVGSSPDALDTLNELAAALGNDPNFATTINNVIAGKAAKATTLGGYGISDAYTRVQTDSAISSATKGKADKANTLSGYGITDALTTSQMNTALGGKLDKSGGTIDGSLYVASTQSLSAPALSIDSSAPGSSLSLLRLRCPNTGVLLSHTNGTSTLSVTTAAGGAATISAGDILSSGSSCHTVASFMKPVAGQWLSIEGALTLPAGGTWAYQFLNFNNTGSFLGGSRTGLVAGGTQIGAATSVGFAWRIQ